MQEQWVVFKDSETGQELGSYTVRGTFTGEAQATKELLAYEKGIPVEQVVTSIEQRASQK